MLITNNSSEHTPIQSSTSGVLGTSVHSRSIIHTETMVIVTKRECIFFTLSYFDLLCQYLTVIASSVVSFVICSLYFFFKF